VYSAIGRAYGPFDVALLPIGAYAPRSLLRQQHVDPEEAVLIHRDVRATRSLGIHWGTWLLSNEPLLDPLEKLEEALRARSIALDEFVTLRRGESMEVK